NLFRQIDFKLGVGIGSNTAASLVSVEIYQCPADIYQQPFPVYDSSFANPIATVAHGNYVGCNGWGECFNNAGGGYQASVGNDGLPGVAGTAGNGLFYRNSKNNVHSVTDGLSNTIFVGERSGNHSPSTWTGAVTGGRCPAWMATQPPA